MPQYNAAEPGPRPTPVSLPSPSFLPAPPASNPPPSAADPQPRGIASVPSTHAVSQRPTCKRRPITLLSNPPS